MASDARGSAAYKRLRAKMRAQGQPCALCGKGINPDAPPRSRWSFSVDHIQPLAHGGDPLDPTNCQPAHLGCNSSRAARWAPPQARRTTPRQLPEW